MRILSIAIVITASVSSAALADLTLMVEEDLIFSASDGLGSFEVFVSGTDSPTLATFQTQINLSPASAGITFDSVVSTTSLDHPYVFRNEADPFFLPSITNGGATIDVGGVFDQSFAGTPPTLNDGDGLFKVNFSIAPATPHSSFDLTINPDPLVTFLHDDLSSPLPFNIQSGQIDIQNTGPHRLKVDIQGAAGGTWGSRTSFIVSYGEIGADSTRNDGIDQDTTWGPAKFEATSEGDYGIYSRDEPFGAGADMLVYDARAIDDTTNVLMEVFTNEVFAQPGQWEPGVTWNEGGTLQFQVLEGDVSFFDEFRLLQKQPGRFLDTDPLHPPPGGTVNVQLADVLDPVSGIGSVPFGRVGCSWGEFEADWLTGPFASFDLDPTGTTPYWSDPDGALSVEAGTVAIFHTPTPEPSSFILLALSAAALGAYAVRRRFRGRK